MKLAQKLEIMSDELRNVILEHHERIDGSGYPQRLSGEAISRLGRLAAVADSFSAMIQKRPYTEAMSPLDAAKTLAGDRMHYDQRFATALMTAYVVNDFAL